MTSPNISMGQLEYWLELFKDPVYRFALATVRQQQTAEDVFQTVFLRMVENEDTLSQKSDAHVKNWLMKVTYNCCMDHFRGTTKEQNNISIDDEALGAGEWLEDEAAASLTDGTKEEGLPVYEAVQALPPDQKSVIHLYYYEQYSVAEIARLLAVQEGVIKTRMHRARKRLSLLIPQMVKEYSV